MPHGLDKFRSQEMIEKAQGATALLDKALEHGTEVGTDAISEAVRIALENQVKIAETLELIKIEFDKFEEGLGKIL